MDEDQVLQNAQTTNLRSAKSITGIRYIQPEPIYIEVIFSIHFSDNVSAQKNFKLKKAPL